MNRSYSFVFIVDNTVQLKVEEGRARVICSHHNKEKDKLAE